MKTLLAGLLISSNLLAIDLTCEMNSSNQPFNSVFLVYHERRTALYFYIGEERLGDEFIQREECEYQLSLLRSSTTRQRVVNQQQVCFMNHLVETRDLLLTNIQGRQFIFQPTLTWNSRLGIVNGTPYVRDLGPDYRCDPNNPQSTPQ